LRSAAGVFSEGVIIDVFGAMPAPAHVTLMSIGEKMSIVSHCTSRFKKLCCVSTFATPDAHCLETSITSGGTRPATHDLAHSCSTTVELSARPVVMTAWKHAIDENKARASGTRKDRFMREPLRQEMGDRRADIMEYPGYLGNPT